MSREVDKFGCFVFFERNMLAKYSSLEELNF